MDELKETFEQTRRWIEQEKVWDDSLYASTSDEKRATGEPVKNQAPQATHSPSSLISRPVSDPSKEAALKSLYERYKDCTRCPLGLTRIKFVFGVGPANAPVLFIGEGPGYEEDHRGEPFVGKAGQLLDRMLEAIGMSRRTNAYIANIVKCHAMADPQTPQARGNDRPPNPEEVEICSPILLEQIAILCPRVIVTLGSPSTKMILNTKEGITGLRGKFFPFPVEFHYPVGSKEAPTALPLFKEEVPEGSRDRRNTGPTAGVPISLTDEKRQALAKIQVLPTYHPAALLRNPNLKPESWADLKLLKATLSSV
jgi:uracil-DNA glycosylase family 4